MINGVNVVLDTNVLVSALWSADGNPSKIVRMIPENIIVPHFCEKILLEYRAVLSRPSFHFNQRSVDELIELFIFFGRNVDVLKSDIMLPDESDRIFFDTAICGKAILITGNLKHFPAEPFIMSPVDFLLKFQFYS
jgi:putative PIN family toxin of toxin-antitoxin system